DFAHHFHTDHPVFSCSIIEQKQLNTWVSFQSAEQPLLGQFSVSGNRQATWCACRSCWLEAQWHERVDGEGAPGARQIGLFPSIGALNGK
ncbi:hypothetical protein N5F07_25070, partial [Pseudomonas chengduensis]